MTRLAIWLGIPGLCVCLAAGAVAVSRRPGAPEPLAAGVFLVAHRKLSDPNFSRSVVLMLSYGEGGAMGLVVNRRTELRLAELLPDAGLDERELPVYAGGPVAPGQLLFLVGAPDAPPDSERVLDGVHVTGSLEALRPLLEAGGVRLHGYVGYAGWASGQLDAEVARGDWHIVAGDPGSVFSAKPDALWQRLLDRAEGVWADSGQGPLPRLELAQLGRR